MSEELGPCWCGVLIKWDRLGDRKHYGSQIRAGTYPASLELGPRDGNGILPMLALKPLLPF